MNLLMVDLRIGSDSLGSPIAAITSGSSSLLVVLLVKGRAPEDVSGRSRRRAWRRAYGWKGNLVPVVDLENQVGV